METESPPAPARPVERDTSAASAAFVHGGTAVLGERSESMRLHIERVSDRIAELDAIRRSFGELVPPMHDFVREHERTRTDLANAEAQLAALRASHEALSTRHDGLLALSDEASRQLALAIAERDAHERRADEAGRDLESARGDLAERESRVASLGEDLARAHSRADLADAQAQQSTERLADTSYRLVSSEASLAAARDAAKVLEGEFAALKATADETAGQVAARNRRISELEMQSDQRRQAHAALEKAHDETKDALAKLADRHAALEQGFAAEKAELASRHDRLAARAAGFETQLAQARKDLRTRIEELRAKERAHDAEAAQVARLRHEVAALNEAAIAAKRRAGDVEAADKAKAERIAAFAKEGDATRLATSQRDAEIAGLRHALAESAASLAKLRDERAQGDARALERFERERSERQIAEGALAAARREIADLRRGVDDHKSAETDGRGRNVA